MAIETTIFSWLPDPQSGVYGWIPKDKPGFNISHPYNVAHDCVEHGPGESGTIADECIAFGTILRGRGVSGDYGPVGFALDCLQLLATPVFERGAYLNDPPFSFHLPYYDVEWHLGQWCEAAQCKLDWVFAPQARNVELLDRIARWIRVGYRRAEQRFPACASSASLVCLFHRVRDLASRQENLCGLSLGSELQVTIDTVTGDVQMMNTGTSHLTGERHAQAA